MIKIKKTISFLIQLSLFLLLCLLTVSGLPDSASLDVPLLATDIGGGCWGASMHMVLNHGSETPFYEEVAYQGGTRFEIRRQFVGGRVDRTGEYTLMEQDTEPNLIETWVIAPENMQHLANDLGYTYHQAYLKSSYHYIFPSISEQEAGEENIIRFSDENEAFLFLKELINNGNPVIVEFPMHFEVVTGYDNYTVFLNDPEKPNVATKATFNNNDFLNEWKKQGYFIQWFTKSHEEKNIDDIMWMLKEAAKRAHKNIKDYAEKTENGIIIDDYTDPESGNNVNHPENLAGIVKYRVHISEFLNAHGYNEIAAKYEESAEKFNKASGLSQSQRVSVLNQIAEIEEEAYTLFVNKLPEPAVELNEPQEIKHTQMQISWTPYTQDDFVSYEIYVSWLPGVLGKKVKTVTDKTETTIENLERSRTYSITVKVNKQQGHGYSNQVTAQTARSPYITYLELGEEWDNVIWITWFRSLRDDVVRFEIYISKEPSFTPTEDKLKDIVPGDLDLIEGAAVVQDSGTYYLKLRTVYEDGTFSDSEEASIIVGEITKRFVEVPDQSENVCGNGNCNSYFGESYENCPQDCPVRPGIDDIGAVCGDGTCVEPQETSENCPQDCSSATGYETDTEAVCGDGRCVSPTETSETCPQDCILGYEDNTKTVCGDGICVSPTETSETCPQDCILGYEDNTGTVCGDGICESPETEDFCCEDCGGCNGNNVMKTGEKSFFGKIINFFKGLFG